MSCTHQHTRETWVTTDYDGEDLNVGYFNYDTTWTTVDLGTHRYTCTQCKKIMYYSERARAYYEDNVICHVDGLDK